MCKNLGICLDIVKEASSLWASLQSVNTLLLGNMASHQRPQI